MKTFLSLLLVFFLQSSRAANYYFSTSSGDDSRTATQAKSPSTPWKTITKLNSFFAYLKPGDSVLLKRGETFFGSITVSISGTSTAPIVIAAYGTGNRPVITSLVTLSGWTVNSAYKGVYDCSANSWLGAKINMLLVNDAEKAMGRYPNIDAPNKGYLILESHSGTTSITDNQLTSTPNWKGAELVLRTCHWILERFLITDHINSTLYYSGSYNPRDNYGYFIQNSIKTLDQFGEWYYNPSTKKLSMYFGSNSPSSYTVKATAKKYLIQANNRSYIVFNNLTLKGSNENGIDVNSGSNISVTNCDILFSGTNGVQVLSHPHFKLENCNVLNSNNSGVSVGTSSTYAIIRNNIIKNTCTLAGMGQAGNNQGLSITINSNGLAEYNQVINSGYIGIRFDGNNCVVKNNYINTFCYIKDDGAGIYTTNSSNLTNYGNKITGNIILNGIGAPAGTNTTGSSAEGIYLDDDVNGVEISGNTIANSNRGIYLHNTRNIVVKNNTSYNNNSGQLHMKHDGFGGSLINNTIIKNLFISRLNTQFTSCVYSSSDDIGSMGQFDSNYYARPIDDRVVISNIKYIYTLTQEIHNRTLDGWKAVYGKDLNSKKSAKQIVPYKVNSLIGSNKFASGAFSSSSDINKITHDSCSVYWGNSGVLDGGYLKVVPFFHTSFIVLNVGSLSSTKKYLLKYSLKGSSNMSIGASLRILVDTNYVPLTKTQFRPVSTARTENDMIFTPSTDQTNGVLFLSVDAQSTYYIDNIKLYEADATITNPDDSIKLVFNPTRVNKTVSLDGNYVDVTGKKYSNSIILPPYLSAVLIKDGGTVTTLTGNTAPAVSITSPSANASYTGPATINISASASDANGTISKVDFYNGTTLLHTDYSAPYNYSWGNVPSGTYTLTAKATDNNNAVTTSAAVKVYVTSSTGNIAPVVSITSPVANKSYTSPASIYIAVKATDSDGTISKVNFYNGTNLIHTEYYSPYEYNWNNVPAGTYTLTAKATDNKGLVSTSSSVKVYVTTTASRPSNNNQSSFVISSSDTANLAETIVSQDEIKADDLRLHPNPATNTIYIDFNQFLSNKRAILTIQNLSGSTLKRYPVVLSGKSLQVDISSLNTGTFIIGLTGEDFNITKKFIKVKWN